MMNEELIVMEHMQIRMATMEDLDEIAFVESECFPFEEAATKEKFAERIKEYGTHFWLMCEEEKVIAFVDGMVTDEKNLTDEMYEKACLHEEKLLRYAINDARAQDREGLVLTCKDKLVHYYEKFGFQNEGVSESVHGGATWYQMRLTF